MGVVHYKWLLNMNIYAYIASFSAFKSFLQFFKFLFKIIFLDFTAKRVTLKWFNLHKLCKITLKQLFLAYAAM